MPHFKAFDMMNMQYEIRICQKILNKATNDKTQHPPPLLSTLPLFLILFVAVGSFSLQPRLHKTAQNLISVFSFIQPSLVGSLHRTDRKIIKYTNRRSSGSGRKCTVGGITPHFNEIFRLLSWVLIAAFFILKE